MSVYKDTNPTYNAGNRKVVNFKDFIYNKEEEKEELKDIKRSFTKNELEVGLKTHKLKYNKVTHKIDDMVEDEVDGRLDAIEEIIEGNEFDEEVGNLDNVSKLYMDGEFLIIITESGKKFNIIASSDDD